jgi:phosphoenolpyruvate carboxykinase (GTP)
MLPFVGLNMNYYLSHWLRMVNKLKQPPLIFHVNWFKQGPDGKFLWPGFGDNLRVLKWMIDRCRNAIPAISTPLGYMPRPEDLDLTGLDIPPANVEQLLAINPEEWRQEMQAREQFMETLGPTMPSGILREHLALAKRLGLG